QLRTTDPKRMALIGTSAGGALVLEMALRMKQDRVALPAAIASGTPMSDITGAGDSFQTNELEDLAGVRGGEVEIPLRVFREAGYLLCRGLKHQRGGCRVAAQTEELPAAARAHHESAMRVEHQVIRRLVARFPNDVPKTVRF